MTFSIFVTLYIIDICQSADTCQSTPIFASKWSDTSLYSETYHSAIVAVGLLLCLTREVTYHSRGRLSQPVLLLITYRRPLVYLMSLVMISTGCHTAALQPATTSPYLVLIYQCQVENRRRSRHQQTEEINWTNVVDSGHWTPGCQVECGWRWQG